MKKISTVGRNTLALFAGTVAQAARGLLMAPLLTRALGPAGYGDYAGALTVVGLAQTPLAPGTSAVITARIARTPLQGGAVLRTATRQALPVAVALFVAMLAAGMHLGGDRGAALGWLSVTIFAGLLQMSGALLTARLRDDLTLAAQLTATTLQLIAVAALVLLHASHQAIFAASALGTLLQAILIARFARRVAPDPSGSASFRLYRPATPMIVTSLLVNLSSSADIVFVVWLTGASTGGIYAAATRIFFFATTLPNALSSSLLATFAVEENEPRSLLRAAGLLAVVAMPMALFASLYAPVLTTLCGRAFVAGLPLFPWLAWRMAIHFVATPLDYYLVARGRPGSVMGAHAGAAAVMLLGCAVAVPRFGAVGAAAAGIACELTKLALLAPRLPPGLLSRLARVTARAGLAAAAGFTVAWAVPGPWMLRTAVALSTYLVAAEAARICPLADLLRVAHVAEVRR